MRIFIYLLAVVSLLGCGVKGPIYFPETPEQQRLEKQPPEKQSPTQVKEAQPQKHKQQP